MRNEDRPKRQKELEAAIEKMSIGGRNQFADCFANFLDLALSFFCNNMDERQMELRKHLEENEDFKNAYIEALNAFGDLTEDYHDPMGDMFMSRISHGEKGQFFTPENVSLLMAEIIMDEKIHDGMTINDPACGSGRTLLMALKHLRERKDVEPILFANDLSLTCAKMTLLNFLVNSVGGEVTCGDTLKLDYENFVFFKIDKVRNITSGKALSTYWQYTQATVKEVEEKRKKWWEWIAGFGWVEYRHFKKQDIMEAVEGIGIAETPAPDPLPTEVKVDETGQMSLF